MICNKRSVVNGQLYFARQNTVALAQLFLKKRESEDIL